MKNQTVKLCALIFFGILAAVDIAFAAVAIWQIAALLSSTALLSRGFLGFSIAVAAVNAVALLAVIAFFLLRYFTKVRDQK